MTITTKRLPVANMVDLWTEAVELAGSGQMPVLAYRDDYKPWSLVIPLVAVLDGAADCPLTLEYTVAMSMEGFCLWVRGQLAVSPPNTVSQVVAWR